MPRFVTGEPPTDADIAAVITKISHRVMRKLRQLGYLEAGLAAAVATGYDPLRDDAPALARAMATSVQQRLAFGERTGQQVSRIGSGFGAEGEAPRLTGPRCASVQGFSLHANTQVPGPSARPVGAPDPVYRPRCGVPGAPGTRRQRRSRLYLHSSVVGRDHGDSPLASGTPRKGDRKPFDLPILHAARTQSDSPNRAAQ
jgi:hypothetical protein